TQAAVLVLGERGEQFVALQHRNAPECRCPASRGPRDDPSPSREFLISPPTGLAPAGGFIRQGRASRAGVRTCRIHPTAAELPCSNGPVAMGPTGPSQGRGSSGCSASKRKKTLSPASFAMGAPGIEPGTSRV